ncbi:homoserine dehydrogenase [Candidatus Sumerlaeota bacterium]|nr:homoserine dehydrogenase [Candidatus Sumerlaeota bacterium]
MAKPLKLGLMGFGTIGSGVVQALRDNADLLDGRCPRRLDLRWVADVRPERLRLVELDSARLTTNADDVVGDADLDVVIELIGGIEPARTLVEQALLSGKHVVTANKAVLAQHGAELLDVAARKEVRLLFEAAVGGGVPVVRGLCECLAANRITRIEGILNGTCNYILSAMAAGHLSYDEALAEAKNLGYAEADSTADVEGIDAANKIAILASLAFGYDIRYGDVYREGIGAITQSDMSRAAQEDIVIKQCALAELLEQDCVAISVRPTLLSAKPGVSGHPLARIDGVNNGVIISGQPIGSVLFAGPGAGPKPTASAVLSDLMWLAQFDQEQDRKAPPPFLTIPTGRRPKICSDPRADPLKHG